jgi:single-stranded DNA-binding protein
LVRLLVYFKNLQGDAMSNVVRITGNVGKNPEMKTVGADKKQLVEFSIFCDEWKFDDATQKQVPNGGEWYEITVWKPDLGKSVFETIRQGARLEIVGHQTINRYTSAEGKDVAVPRINADDVLHKLNRVESIQLRPKQEPANA